MTDNRYTPPSPLQPEWPQRNWQLGILLSANMLSFADRYVLSAVVPGLRADIFNNPDQYWWPVKFVIMLLAPLLGTNPENSMIGLLGMAFMVSYMVCAPVATSLKLHRWYIIGVGLILWSFFTGGTGFCETFEMMLLNRMMVGVGEACYGPIAPTMIADMHSPAKRAMAMAFYQMTTPVGSAIGYGVGAWVMVTFGWRWAFWVAAAPGILLGVICFFMKDPTHEAAVDKPKPSWKERMAEFSGCMRNKSYVYNLFAATAMTFAIGGIGFWIPSYLVEFRKLGHPEVMNLVFGGILLVGGLGGTLVGGWYADRKNRTDKSAYMKVSGWSMWLTLIFTVAMLYRPFPEAWAYLALAIFFLFFNTGSASAIITNCIAPEHRASAFALSIFVTHALGDVISPFVIGAVADATGDMNKAFMGVSLAVTISALLWQFGARYLEADSKHADK